VKTFQRDLSGYDTVFGHARSPYTCVDTVRLWRTNTIRHKPKVETVPQTGSTNNLATETDINAISAAIPMFGGKVSLVYMSTLPNISFTQKIQDGGRTGNSYNFATENDTKVISAAVAMFQRTADPPPASTLSN